VVLSKQECKIQTLDKEEIIAYWVDSAAVDLSAMENLLEHGHFSWALFVGHLILEKMLKACLVKSGSAEVPRTHDLLKIAGAAGLVLDERQKDLLDEVTTFNLKARYPDYRQRFYRKATREFAQKNIESIKGFQVWLLEQIKS